MKRKVLAFVSTMLIIISTVGTYSVSATEADSGISSAKNFLPSILMIPYDY